LAKIIPFRTRKQLDKEKRDKVWNEWLEFERWEEENLKYQQNKESDEVFNFDDPDNVNEYFMSKEELNFLKQEEKVARKEMMKNKNQKNSDLKISLEEWEWLNKWMKSME